LWATVDQRRNGAAREESRDYLAPREERRRASNNQRNRNRDQPVESMTMFGSEVMLVVTAEDFFEPKAAKAIREVVDKLRALPQVANVTWMDNAPPLNIFGLPEPALPDYRASLATI
jgi:uncharacterized protein